MDDLALMAPQQEVDTLSGNAIQPSFSGATEVQVSNGTEVLMINEPFNVTSCTDNSTIYEINGLLLPDDIQLPDSAAPRAVDLDGDQVPGPSNTGSDVGLRALDVLEQGQNQDTDQENDGNDDVWLGMDTSMIAGIFSAVGVGLVLAGAACAFFVFGVGRRKHGAGGGSDAAAQGGAGGPTGSATAASGNRGGGTGTAAPAVAAAATTEQMHQGHAAGTLRSVEVWDEGSDHIHSAPLPGSQPADPLSPGAAQPWLPAPPRESQKPQQSWMQMMFGRREPPPAQQHEYEPPQSAHNAPPSVGQNLSSSSYHPSSGGQASGQESPAVHLPMPPSPTHEATAPAGLMQGATPSTDPAISPVSSLEQSSRGVAGHAMYGSPYAEAHNEYVNPYWDTPVPSIDEGMYC